MIFRLVAVWAMIPAIFTAQDIQTSALSFVLDQSIQRVRPIVGVPLAATIGAPLDAPSDVRQLEVSPRHDYLLALSGTEHAPSLFLTLGGLISPSSLKDVAFGADRIFLSPDGHSAAFYFEKQRRVQVLTGLPRDMKPVVELDVSAMGTSARVLAIDDSGRIILAAGKDSSEGMLWVFRMGGSATSLPTLAPVHAAAFLAHSPDAIVASTQGISLVRDIGATASVTDMATGATGPFDPVAVSGSEDGRSAYVADGTSGSIYLLRVDGSPAKSISCACSPSGFLPLAHTELLGISPYDGVSAIQVLDARTPLLRMTFIPAASQDDHR